MPIYVHLAWDGGTFVIRGETETFQRIAEFELPEEPHPEALVDPEHRRTITRE